MRFLTALGLSITLGFGGAAIPAAAQSLDDPTVSTQVASVTFGPYVRAELGALNWHLEDAYWLPPGPADPQINFDLDGDNTGMAAIAIGYDWQNGFRGDFSLIRTGQSDIAGPCSSASDGSSCTGTPHADITGGTITTTALMANVFYSPLERQGSNSVFQPFVVAGLGFAHNDVGVWTRTNLAAPRPVRSFESNSSLDLAWSLGIGAAWQVSRAGQRPVIIEASWRYYDFGTASGGTTPIGPGSTPREGLTFENRSQVFSIGVRIPLDRL